MIYAFNDKKEKIDLLDYFYPVGSIYETSSDSFNPNSRWGGTWTKIQDKVLVGSGSLFPSGTTGGHKVVTYTPAGTVGGHTLTVAEMPKHSHAVEGSGTQSTTLPMGSDDDVVIAGTGATSEVGGGGSHSHTFTGTQATLDNMPPYEVLNIWKRIA